MSSRGTVSEAPPGVTINLVNPDYIGYRLVFSSIVCSSISFVVVILRLYTRQFIVRVFGWDDAWMLLAWILATGLTVANILETKYGMGYHVWDILVDDFNTYLKLQIFVGATYILTLTFLKFSICSFYLRLSPERSFRLQVFILMGVTAAISISGFLVLVFSCNPVAASWDLALEALPTTKCINRPANYLAQSSFYILTDIWVFILPLKIIWSLHLPFRQKVGVSTILMLGLLACIVSIIRLNTIVVVLKSKDPSWDTTDILIWSTVEVNAAIIAACIATLRPFVKRFIPRLLGKASSAATAYPSIAGKATKINGGSEWHNAPAFPLHSFNEQTASGHMAQVSTKICRDTRRRDEDAESQENIVGIKEAEWDTDGTGKEGVLVTRTVHIS